MELKYNINDKPKLPENVVFAFQQLLAIMAATIAVPAIIGNGMSQSAALFGAGVGTFIYLLFTKSKSPVFLGSSFAFLGSMAAAFAGASSVELGYVGLLIGGLCCALVYTIISGIVRIVGTDWIDKLMPPQVIGPTVAIIGLSLAGNAVGDLTSSKLCASPWICLACGLITGLVTIAVSIKGKKNIKMFPFIIGIVCGYACALIFTLIGFSTNNPAFQVIDLSPFQNLKWIPEFTFARALNGIKELSWAYVMMVIIAYAPVAFVVFAEHIADHKNLSSIVGTDLLKEPGLSRTLLGDGIGSFVGAFFGGCPNTTYFNASLYSNVY